MHLAHRLWLRLVAEGVKRAEQAAELRALGDDVLQGWHLGRPAAPGALRPQLPVGESAAR